MAAYFRRSRRAQVLLCFPLLGAATGAALAPGDGLLAIQAVLFALMAFAVAMTLAVLYAFWLPAGSAYNVDAVLGVMVDGLDREIDERAAAIEVRFFCASLFLVPRAPLLFL